MQLTIYLFFKVTHNAAWMQSVVGGGGRCVKLGGCVVVVCVAEGGGGEKVTLQLFGC